MGRSSSVATVVVHETESVMTASGPLTFVDFVDCPPRRHLPGLSTPQVLVQVENADGDLLEMTVPEWTAIVQSAFAEPGSDSRRIIFSNEALSGVSDVRRREVEQLAELLRRFDAHEIVLGVQKPPPRRGVAGAWELLIARLKELGYTGVESSTLYKKMKELRESGWSPALLLDKDELPATDPLDREHPGLVEHTRAYLLTLGQEPTPGIGDLQRGLTAYLRDVGVDPEAAPDPQSPEGTVRYSREARKRVLNELSRSRNVGSDMATFESTASKPKGLQGRLTASMPFESLQIDAWTVDAEALDQYGKRIRMFLITAIDTLTRKLRALRLLPSDATMRDIKLLIFDTVKGAPIWPVGEPTCPRLPDFVELAPSVVAHLRKENPDFQPVGMIHVDNGSAMIGSETLSAAASLNIHVQPARPGRGSDKANVEAFFATLAKFVKGLPGATGSKPAKRPRRISRLLSVQHLEIFLRLWVECVYHERPHSGLRRPEFPGLHLSPNTYESALLRSQRGLGVSTHPFAAVSLLHSVGGRVAHKEGFRNRNRDYDAEGTERLKEYSQGAQGLGLASRPLYTWEHTYDSDAVVVREPSGDLLVLPHRDLTAALKPLADEEERGLREMLLAAVPPGHAGFVERRDMLVAMAHRMAVEGPASGGRQARKQQAEELSSWEDVLQAEGLL